MQHHEPTKAYVTRRTAEGKTKAVTKRAQTTPRTRTLGRHAAATRHARDAPWRCLTDIGASMPWPRRRSGSTRPNAPDPAHRFRPDPSLASATSRRSPAPGRTGTTPPGSCTASAGDHRPNTKPTTTLRSATTDRSLTPNEASAKPGTVHIFTLAETIRDTERHQAERIRAGISLRSGSLTPTLLSANRRRP